jgi:hypothetical protein
MSGVTFRVLAILSLAIQISLPALHDLDHSDLLDTADHCAATGIEVAHPHHLTHANDCTTCQLFAGLRAYAPIHGQIAIASCHENPRETPPITCDIRVQRVRLSAASPRAPPACF